MKDYYKLALQGVIASAVAGVIGVIYGLIRGLDLLHGANRFIYILGILLIFSSMTSNVSIFQKHQEGFGKVFSSKEVQNHMRERNKGIRNAPKQYTRAVVVMLMAMLLETIRFYVL